MQQVFDTANEKMNKTINSLHRVKNKKEALLSECFFICLDKPM